MGYYAHPSGGSIDKVSGRGWGGGGRGVCSRPWFFKLTFLHELRKKNLVTKRL